MDKTQQSVILRNKFLISNRKCNTFLLDVKQKGKCNELWLQTFRENRALFNYERL